MALSNTADDLIYYNVFVTVGVGYPLGRLCCLLNIHIKLVPGQPGSDESHSIIFEKK